MSQKGHIPIRTCIGCRIRRKKEEMIGFTLDQQGVVKVIRPFLRQGRGVYLCPDIGCFDKAKKKNRGLRFMEKTEFKALFGRDIFKKSKDGIEEEVNDQK